MPILRLLTFPFAWLYGFAILVRNLFYKLGIYPSKKFDFPVIVVGNLSTGGTGKSPHIEYLIRLLHKKFKVATLSRGYGRRSKGFQFAEVNSTSELVGDEPLQFKKKFPQVTVAVNGNRVKGIEKIKEKFPDTQAILLDDAFQHRRVKAGLNILLTDFSRPFFKDMLLPMGNLREWKFGKKRAQIIVVTKCPKTITAEQKLAYIRRIAPTPTQRVFFSYLKYSAFLGLHDARELRTNPNFTALLVTGIASPGMLYSYLKKNFKVLDHLPFDDHHEFTDLDAEKIKSAFLRLPGANRIIITTEKDAMRMTLPGFKELPIYYLPVEVGFLERELEFNELITKYIQTNSF